MSANTENPVVFLACSDLHLSDRPPRVRGKEWDWIRRQSNVLREVLELARKHQCFSILFAGDFFHRPRVSPELERMTIEVLQEFSDIQWLIIPGQHDLPSHLVDKIHQASLGVLRAALPNLIPVHGRSKYNGIWVYGVPYGVAADSTVEADVVLSHQLVWYKTPAFPGAPETGNAANVVNQFHTGVKLIVTGDNHQAFEYADDHYSLVNCGAMMRRTLDQVDYVPSVVLVHKDWSCSRVPLDITHDVFSLEDSIQIGEQSQKDKKALQEFIGLLVDTNRNEPLSFTHAVTTVTSSRMVTREVLDYIHRIQVGD